MLARHARQFAHTRNEIGQNPAARNRFIARMQRREFHRNPRPRLRRRIAGVGADRRDRRRIGIEIFFGVGCGPGAFAEHVERITEFAVRPGARQRLVDGLAQHEMGADQAHGLACGGAHRRQAEPPHNGVEDRFRHLAGMDDAGGDAKRPG